MVPLKYLGQLVFDKCVPLPRRIFFFFFSASAALDPTVAFIEPRVLEAWNSLVQNLTGLQGSI